ERRRDVHHDLLRLHHRVVFHPRLLERPAHALAHGQEGRGAHDHAGDCDDHLAMIGSAPKAASSSAEDVKCAAIGAPKISALCALFASSWVKPNLASPSAIWRRTLNRAKKTGICSSSGRHPMSGLVPLSW